EPYLLVSRNIIADGAVGLSQVNSGALYVPRPPKVTRSFGLKLSGPIFSTAGFQYPCTLPQPLLKPGLTKFNSSPKLGPFSESHRYPVTGSQSIPKLFLIP